MYVYLYSVSVFLWYDFHEIVYWIIYLDGVSAIPYVPQFDGSDQE